jgi:putative transcriptional regulator
MESRLDMLKRLCYTQRMERRLSIPNRRDGMKNCIEELRKSRGMTQEELASALEVSRQTIGSLENGRYNPSILLAIKIARYFHVQVEDVFMVEED